jgi:hypothetical protein
MSRRPLLLLALCALALPAPAAGHPNARSAQEPTRLDDLFALGQGEGQLVERVATARRADEPPLRATPQVPCGPGARREPGIQGRVPAGAAALGLQCNAEAVGRHGQSGGFKVLRYVDRAGRECAFYDTALLFPLNALKASADSLGVAVLDMADPTKPVQTATLLEPPMLSPHESLVLNEERGLLAAVNGNPSAYPGVVSIYDVSQDCRTPVLQSTAPVARLGHESGFSPDGRTFWATSTAFGQVTAIDVSNPKDPRPVWQGRFNSHGLSLSRDGRLAYATDTGGELVVLDVREVQDRLPNPKVREISRLTWDKASIPQNAIPFSRDGRRYVIETDEYTDGTTGGGDRDAVGAARIIDVTEPAMPRMVSHLRLQVHQPEDHRAAAGDPGAFSPVQGYAAHYCDVPGEDEPLVVACSMIASGLRVFDISDLEAPKEIAYHVAPTRARAENGFQASAFAMSKPTVVAARREVWYSDGTAGFHTVRVAPAVWPTAAKKVARVCGSRRRFAVRVRLPRGARVRAVRATLAGKPVRGARRRGSFVRLTVDLRGRPRQRVTLRVRVTLRDGRTVSQTRRYRTCA